MAARATVAGLVLALLAALGGPRLARAEGTASGGARSLFEAQSLLVQGRYREACEKLEQSELEGPALATRWSLADCWEKAGRVASARQQYQRIAADPSADAASRALATVRASKLEPRLTGSTLPVGAAAGKGPPPSLEAAAPANPSGEPEKPAAPSYTAAYVAGGVGIASLSLAALSAWRASSKLQDARKLCAGSADCPPALEDDYAALKQSARHARELSQVAVGVGALGLVAGGVLLYVTRKQEARQAEPVHVAPSIGMDGVGVNVSGDF